MTDTQQKNQTQQSRPDERRDRNDGRDRALDRGQEVDHERELNWRGVMDERSEDPREETTRRTLRIQKSARALLWSLLSPYAKYLPLLTIAVLVPFANERISLKDILSVFTSWPGILALVGGAIATYMNGKGLDLLKIDPQLIVGLVIGSILGIVFLRGIPVGPLMAAGITALLLKISTYLFDLFSS